MDPIHIYLYNTNEHALHVIEFLELYFYESLKMKKQSWISENNHQITSFLKKIKSTEDGKKIPSHYSSN